MDTTYIMTATSQTTKDYTVTNPFTGKRVDMYTTSNVICPEETLIRRDGTAVSRINRVGYVCHTKGKFNSGVFHAYDAPGGMSDWDICLCQAAVEYFGLTERVSVYDRDDSGKWRLVDDRAWFWLDCDYDNDTRDMRINYYDYEKGKFCCLYACEVFERGDGYYKAT